MSFIIPIKPVTPVEAENGPFPFRVLQRVQEMFERIPVQRHSIHGIDEAAREILRDIVARGEFPTGYELDALQYLAALRKQWHCMFT